MLSMLAPGATMADAPRRRPDAARNFVGLTRPLRKVLLRLPELVGLPITIEWRPALRAHRGQLHSGPGPGDEVHAATFPRQRIMVFASELNDDDAERARIFTHEVFHFVWIKLSNARRRDWEQVLLAEYHAHARGDLGWSAEWRKLRITAADVELRTRLWREYACESFCDTAAWHWSGVADHEEHRLADRWRARRKSWLDRHLSGPLRI